MSGVETELRENERTSEDLGFLLGYAHCSEYVEDEYELANEIVKKNLERVPGVARVDVWGADPERIFIDFDRDFDLDIDFDLELETKEEIMVLVEELALLVADIDLPAVPYPGQVQRLMRAWLKDARRMRHGRRLDAQTRAGLVEGQG